jgi:acetyl-CoA carboxylase biotin carboxyl carrier protein
VEGPTLLTFEQIKELIELVVERGLAGLEIERAGFKLRIDGQGARSAVAPPLASPAAGAVAEPAAGGGPAAPAAPPPAAAARAEEAAKGLHIVTSPIVGTFYTAPSPDADAYVKRGDRVKKGQVLCIIEAMKLMNEIESDVDGEIVEIYPRNAQPVEFGERLFGIRPE